MYNSKYVCIIVFLSSHCFGLLAGTDISTQKNNTTGDTEEDSFTERTEILVTEDVSGVPKGTGETEGTAGQGSPGTDTSVKNLTAMDNSAGSQLPTGKSGEGDSNKQDPSPKERPNSEVGSATNATESSEDTVGQEVRKEGIEEGTPSPETETNSPEEEVQETDHQDTAHIVETATTKTNDLDSTEVSEQLTAEGKLNPINLSGAEPADTKETGVPGGQSADDPKTKQTDSDSPNEVQTNEATTTSAPTEPSAVEAKDANKAVAVAHIKESNKTSTPTQLDSSVENSDHPVEHPPTTTPSSTVIQDSDIEDQNLGEKEPAEPLQVEKTATVIEQPSNLTVHKLPEEATTPESDAHTISPESAQEALETHSEQVQSNSSENTQDERNDGKTMASKPDSVTAKAEESESHATLDHIGAAPTNISSEGGKSEENSDVLATEPSSSKEELTTVITESKETHENDLTQIEPPAVKTSTETIDTVVTLQPDSIEKTPPQSSTTGSNSHNEILVSTNGKHFQIDSTTHNQNLPTSSEVLETQAHTPDPRTVEELDMNHKAVSYHDQDKNNSVANPQTDHGIPTITTNNPSTLQPTAPPAANANLGRKLLSTEEVTTNGTSPEPTSETTIKPITKTTTLAKITTASPTRVKREKKQKNAILEALFMTIRKPVGETELSETQMEIVKAEDLTAPAQYSEAKHIENSRFYMMNLDSETWDVDKVALKRYKVAVICAKGVLEGEAGHLYPVMNSSELWLGQNLTACKFDQTCPGKIEDVKLSNVNYENIKVTSTPDMPVVIISYLTTHYGYWPSHLIYTFENRGCMYLFPYNHEGCWFINSKNTFSPVSTFVIKRKFLNENSYLDICAIKKEGQGNIKGTWRFGKHPIRIWFNEDRTRGLRRLLSVKVNSIPKQKVNTWCHSRSHLIPIEKHELHTHKRIVPRPRVAFCNDSVVTNLPLGVEHGCYSVGKMKVHYQCTPKTHALNVPNECNITTEPKCETGNVCFSVSLNGQGMVSASVAGRSNQVKNCLNKCTFQFPKTLDLDVLFTCPEGKQHRIQTNIVDIQCPWHNLLGRPALYICRATYRPTALYFTLFWITFGYVCFCVAMEILKFVIMLSCKLICICKEKADRTRGYCEHCKLWVNSSIEWTDHRECKVSRCPFCEKHFAKSEFSQHAAVCTKKENKLETTKAVLTVRRTPKLLLWSAVILTKYFRIICKISWGTILLALCLLIISPVRGFETGISSPGIWEEYEQEVHTCKEDCVKLDDGCICNEGELNALTAKGSNMRSLKSIVVQGPDNSPTFRPHKVLKSIDVEAPWGTLHVPESYSPAQSAKHISLSWESSQLIGDKVVLTGKSSAVLKLEPKTSTVWTMSNKDAKEKKTLTISILDYTQIYSAEFLYVTGDRLIKTWSEGSCSGNCPDNCGCLRQTCHVQNWLNVRNWRCNPTWCWRIGTGCSCCASDISELFQDWLVSIWKIEHQKTAVIACVEFDHDQRICESVEAGVEIQLGPVKVSFSDPFGETKVLSHRIAIYHKVPGTANHIDFYHNYGLSSATSFCNIQSCTHGTVGDYQVFDPDAFVLDDVTSPNYFKRMDNSTKVWMSWEGVSVSYYCNPGDWTTCVSDNIVERNGDAFSNVFKSETNFSTTHFFHSTRITGAGKTMALDLKGRPLSSGGDMTAYVTVEGLELFSKEIHLEGLKLTLGLCKGCFACNLGATCEITLSIRKPDSFNLHIRSKSPGVVVPDTSFLVESDKHNSFTIKVFSVEKEPKVCLEIVERKFCQHCPESNVVSCQNVKFEDPKEIALEHRSTIFSKSTQKCGNSTMSCLFSGASSFFKGIGGFFSGYFGSIIKGVLMTILPIALIVLTVFYGPKLAFVLKFCKKGRALKNITYKPIEPVRSVDDYLGKELHTDEARAVMKSLINKLK
ncbi:glycoprotein precursor [Gossas virus]|uniref:M polyprotein n=1 Tax=Gossas virus TaxID=1714376 RepID=A0A0M4KXL1_9VIRU|nr:glycoprotein precursor [Gossas virus]ALD83625.1 glycoprotein precursor [Gossas virus]